MTGVIGMSAKFFSPSIRDTLVSMSEAKSVMQGVMNSATATAATTSATAAGLAAGCLAAAATSTAMVPKELGKAAAAGSAAQVVGATAKSAAQNGLKYNPFGPGKIVGPFLIMIIQELYSGVVVDRT
jgi:hypothetical protein